MPYFYSKPGLPRAFTSATEIPPFSSQCRCASVPLCYLSRVPKTVLCIFSGLAVLATVLAAAEHPAPLPIPDADAKTESQMKPYTDLIEHTDAKIEMLPIRGGKFLMGSPDNEKGRYPDEGP